MRRVSVLGRPAVGPLATLPTPHGGHCHVGPAGASARHQGVSHALSTWSRQVHVAPLGGWSTREDPLPATLGKAVKGEGTSPSTVNLVVQKKKSSARKSTKPPALPEGLTAEGLRRELKLLNSLSERVKAPGKAGRVLADGTHVHLATGAPTEGPRSGNGPTPVPEHIADRHCHASVHEARSVAITAASAADADESIRDPKSVNQCRDEQDDALRHLNLAHRTSHELSVMHPDDRETSTPVSAAVRRARELALRGSSASETFTDSALGLTKSDDVEIRVRHGSTVLGSDLDRVEHDFLNDFHQRRESLPALDDVYATVGGGRHGDIIRKQPNHIIAEGYRQQKLNAFSQGVGSSAFPHRLPRNGKGVNLARQRADMVGCTLDAVEAAPAESNPHFPVNTSHLATGSEADHFNADFGGGRSGSQGLIVGGSSSTAFCEAPEGTRAGDSDVFDAYNQRPADHRLLKIRDADFWLEEANRTILSKTTDYLDGVKENEKLLDGPMDTSEVDYSANIVRKETLLYFQAHPINEMIQESFVRLREILPIDGSESIYVERGGGMDVDVPAKEARNMAQELGLDLIRVGTKFNSDASRRVVAECIIADHREHLRDILRFKIQKLGVQPPPTRQCIEVPFRGGIHPHAIRFKSIGIAKHLLQRFPVRINLTDFGTPREGFPVLQCILDEVKRQCLHLKAFHTAGSVHATYDEIYCYLQPSTGRSPKTTVRHPSEKELNAARDHRILQNEREITFDDYNDQPTYRDRLRYATKLSQGLAWAEKDEGLSLQRQRDMKVMLGYLPKGNHEMYAMRGDVNVSNPFRASHPTSIDRWGYPGETNIDQASRGAATLGKRATMPISEMHDQGETPENPTTLDRFYYRVQGPALEVGEFKEALGLKNNRRKLPRMAPGWATLGVADSNVEAPPSPSSA